MIKIRFYDNSISLITNYQICKKLQNELSKEANGDLFQVEFYSYNGGLIKKVDCSGANVEYIDIIDNDYCIENDDFCYVLLDLKWDEKPNILNDIVEKYNIDLNVGKVKLLLYSTVGTNNELNETYKSIKATYTNLLYFEAPTRILSDDNYINYWCKRAAKLFSSQN